MESAGSNTAPGAPAGTGPLQALFDTFRRSLATVNIQNFLENHLGTAEQADAFCSWLNSSRPRKPDLNYAATAADLFPGVEESQISYQPAKVIHVSALGFKHTPKVPMNETCIQLAERILFAHCSNTALHSLRQARECCTVV